MAPYSVVCLQVVHLLLERFCPEVLADELDHIQVVRKTNAISREPAYRMHISLGLFPWLDRGHETRTWLCYLSTSCCPT